MSTEEEEYETIELDVTDAEKAVYDAIFREGVLSERERIVEIIKRELEHGEVLHKNDDCSSDCYKCEWMANGIIGSTTRMLKAIEGDNK
jgi:hypothetical protein